MTPLAKKKMKSKQPSSMTPSVSTEESDIICKDSSAVNNEKLAEPQQSVASATITFSKTPKRSMEPIRKFVSVWLCFNDYDWLHYGVKHDKVLCFDCTNASRHGTHYTVYRTTER